MNNNNIRAAKRRRMVWKSLYAPTEKSRKPSEVSPDYKRPENNYPATKKGG